jgi:hypothetical protein
MKEIRKAGRAQRVVILDSVQTACQMVTLTGSLPGQSSAWP